MENKMNHPGVYIPPPLIYAAIFMVSLLFQKYSPLDNVFFQSFTSRILGIILIFIGFFINIPALVQFLKSKNTVVTIKPARSLQTSGIYAITRNPMYISLALFYIGLAFLVGNWWTIVFFPVLLLIVQEYVIKHEEKYLESAFGQEYLQYKSKVRRWV
jgi:protein-S-isoprenylcysteine O-methyltransferase Ste14